MALTPWSYDFTGTNGAAWSTTYFSAPSNYGTATIQSNQGRLLTNSGSSYIPVDVNVNAAYTDANFDVYFDTSFPDVTNEQYFQFLFRGNGGGDAWWTSVRVDTGLFTIRRFISGSPTDWTILTRTVLTSDAIHWRVRCISNFIGVKIWYNAETEPTAWTGYQIDSTAISTSNLQWEHKNGAAALAQTCNVDNIVVTVPVAAAPDAPTGLTATGGVASAALAWTAPAFNGGSAITDYLVEYSSNSGATWSTFSHTASTTPSITVTGLSNNTAYLFRVSAVNAIGTGTASGTASATTFSVPATMVAPVVDTPSHLGAHFFITAPSNGGSAITDYSVQYSSNGGASWTAWSHSASTALEINVTGVPAGTVIFQVAAVNSIGTGSWSPSSGNVTVQNMAGRLLLEGNSDTLTESNSMLNTEANT